MRLWVFLSLLALAAARSHAQARRDSSKESSEESSEEDSSEESFKESSDASNEVFDEEPNNDSDDNGMFYDVCSIGEGEQRGQMEDKVIEEASGLAMSGLQEGILWTITDHSGPNIVYAVREDGIRIADVTLEGAVNSDWEDIAVDVEDGVSFIYVSDTGNNDHDKPLLSVYKFPEPQLSLEPGQEVTIPAGDLQVIELSYPDFSYDCETLAVDPETKDLLLFTKDREDSISEVYRSSQSGGVLEHIGTLPLFWVTGGDISPSGSTLGLTNKEEAWSFSKPADQSWVEYLASGPEPCLLQLEEEEQRESLAVTDTGYWSTSECKDSPPCPLWYYPMV